MEKLAICIPTYNEKDNIIPLVEKVQKEVQKAPINVTVIVIDDNSPDGTGKLADRLAAKYQKHPFIVEVIHRKGKLGLASAYMDAFKKALSEKYDYILTMDCDFSHQPKYIPIFLKEIKEYDMVIGSRNVKGGRAEDWSFLRHLISKGGSLYARTILGVPINDFTGGFNLYRYKVLKSLDFDSFISTGFSYVIEIKYQIAKKGFSFLEVPIIFPDRKKGKPKMNKKIFFEAMLRVWQIRFGKKKK
jgi:dolichol-phosphate mannosyltransferase